MVAKVDILTRLLARIQIEDKDDPCWLWQGPVNNCGYGLIRDMDALPRTKMRTVHRVMAEHSQLDILGKEVCHTCDTPNCVNPDHLWVGTHKENMKDCADKGRSKIGPNSMAGKTYNRVVCQACGYNHASSRTKQHARFCPIHKSN